MAALHRGALVAITDERDDVASVCAKSAAVCTAGCPFLQLRMRHLDARDLTDLATTLRRTTRDHGVRLLINDRIDLAIAVDADGVHLPTSGMAPRPARALIGEERLLGRSVHSIDEIVALRDEPIDYLQFGPVFATPSKAAYGRPQGIENLRRAVEAAGDRPVFAVGGITITNAASVASTGTAGVAVIAAVMGSDQLEDTARALLDLVARRR